jgi:tetratricopeptide (TPR) repeat protein
VLLRGLFFSWIACFLVAAGVFAQPPTQGPPGSSLGKKGLVQGTVETPGGKPLSGISIKLQSMENGFMRIDYTDADGHFAFANLPSGNYMVAIEALGYQPERQSVRLDSPPTTHLSFTLKRDVTKARPEDVYTVSVRQLQVPKKAREEYQKGLEKYQRGKIEEAVKHWNKSITLYPQYVESYLQLSRAYFDRNDLPRALEMAQSAVAADEGNANSLCILGYVYVQTKNYPKAKEAFRKSLLASPSQWLSHFWLAWLLLKENQAQEAYEHVVLAKQLRPEVPEIHIVLFNSLARLGRIQEAVKELNYFLEHFPDHPMARKVRERRDLLLQSLASGKR